MNNRAGLSMRGLRPRKANQMAEKEVHTQVTGDEIAKTFDSQVQDVDLSVYAPEDWITLAVFWLMTGCVFLQFFSRYVLNDSYAWT